MAEETRTKVKSEEEQAANKARETQAIADDAQRDLSEALPALVSPTPSVSTCVQLHPIVSDIFTFSLAIHCCQLLLFLI